jgi:hypothetical protein
MTQHTPGPWKTSFLDDTRIEDKNGSDVAMALGEYSTESDRMEANARLIAAAPDLLEAAKSAWMLIEQINEFGKCVDGQTFDLAYDKVKAAIAKAKGEA